MERYRLQTLLMSDQDLRVLQEVLSCVAEDRPLTISAPDRARTRVLYEQMVERFGKVSEGEKDSGLPNTGEGRR